MRLIGLTNVLVHTAQNSYLGDSLGLTTVSCLSETECEQDRPTLAIWINRFTLLAAAVYLSWTAGQYGILTSTVAT